MVVDEFDPRDKLFDDQRYQLQLSKTGNMLIGTEALRESITKLRDRLDVAHSMLSANDYNLQVNSQFNDEVGDLLEHNSKNLEKIDARIYDLEAGYDKLNFK